MHIANSGRRYKELICESFGNLLDYMLTIPTVFQHFSLRNFSSIDSLLFIFPGVRAVAECLAKSTSEETQDRAKTLIQELSNVS